MEAVDRDLIDGLLHRDEGGTPDDDHNEQRQIGSKCPGMHSDNLSGPRIRFNARGQRAILH